MERKHFLERLEHDNEYCAVVISEDGVHDIIDTNTIDKITQDLADPYGKG